MDETRISIIIPCYWANPDLIALTMKCLDSLDGAVDEVLVIDDGSPLKYEPPKPYMLVRRKKNGGYAAAVNSGLKKATGNVLIIANNDIEFIDPHWLNAILEPLGSGYGVSSIRTTDADGWTTEDRLEENAKFGSLWAMSRFVYEQVGPLDERFGKGLFEDLDYWHRVRDAGFKIVKNHKGIVEHHGKATFKVVDPTDKQFLRNMFIYKEKWGDKAWIVETSPGKVRMFDDYELDEESRKRAKDRELTLEEAERRLGRFWHEN